MSSQFPRKATRAILCVLGYTEAVLAAERRLRKGERQLYCGECGVWRWPDECDHPGRLTQQQFNAAIKRIAAQVRRDYPSQEDRYREGVNPFRVVPM